MERAGARTFDVRGWLANLVRCDDLIVGETTYHDDDSFTAVYRCGGAEVATVVMRGISLAKTAHWELLAQLPDRVERAMLPGDARFVW
jgi:thiazole synthase ThiGH ThiG subunit